MLLFPFARKIPLSDQYCFPLMEVADSLALNFIATVAGSSTSSKPFAYWRMVFYFLRFDRKGRFPFPLPRCWEGLYSGDSPNFSGTAPLGISFPISFSIPANLY